MIMTVFRMHNGKQIYDDNVVTYKPFEERAEFIQRSMTRSFDEMMNRAMLTAEVAPYMFGVLTVEYLGVQDEYGPYIPLKQFTYDILYRESGKPYLRLHEE